MSRSYEKEKLSHGISVAVIGTDGAEKSTLVKNLLAYFRKI